MQEKKLTPEQAKELEQLISDQARSIEAFIKTVKEKFDVEPQLFYAATFEFNNTDALSVAVNGNPVGISKTFFQFFKQSGHREKLMRSALETSIQMSKIFSSL